MRDESCLDAALKLFLRTGVRKTSADDIAAACGTTRMTLYRRLGTKWEIVDRVVEAMLERIDLATTSFLESSHDTVSTFISEASVVLRRLSPDGIERLLLELSQESPDLYVRVLEHQTRVATTLVERLLQMAGDEFEVDQTVSPEVQRVWVRLVIDHLPRALAQEHLPISPDAVFEQAARLMLFGLTGRKGTST